MLALMLSTMAAGLLTADPVLRVASPGLSGVNVPEKTAAFYSEHLAQQLSLAGAKVTTNREMSAVLGLERQRQLMGCNDAQNPSCLVELANALGVDAVLVGDVAKLEKKYQVNVKLISARSAEAVALYSARPEGEEALLDELTRAARQLAANGARALHRSLAAESNPVTTPTPRPEAVATASAAAPGANARSLAWIPAAVGVVGAGFGAFAAVQANSRYDMLTGKAGPLTVDPVTLRDEGKNWALATQVSFGVGAAGLIAGALMWTLGGEARPAASVGFVPGGMTVGFAWEMP